MGSEQAGQHPDDAVDDGDVAVSEAVPEGGYDEASEREPEVDPGPLPPWWHRDHPTFYALAGFFTGLVLVIVVPSIFVGVVRLLMGAEAVEEHFPWVAAVLALPAVLLVPARTRRFGAFVLLGMLLTVVVVVSVSALSLWVMVRAEG